MTGMTICFVLIQKSSKGEVYPAMGSRPSSDRKIHEQQAEPEDGGAYARFAKVVVAAASIHVPRRTAAMSPSRIPKTASPEKATKPR